jgi:hypothetical protein
VSSTKGELSGEKPVRLTNGGGAQRRWSPTAV